MKIIVPLAGKGTRLLPLTKRVPKPLIRVAGRPVMADGILWAKEVEDYQRFGVIVTDQRGYMKTIVEKPSTPVSRLANIGLYYVKDWKTLFDGIAHVLEQPPGKGGEYYLTDAFQYMV